MLDVNNKSNAIVVRSYDENSTHNFLYELHYLTERRSQVVNTPSYAGDPWFIS
jgi:hypothetical protein